MNFHRVSALLLGVAMIVGSSAAQDLAAQSFKQRIEQQQREMELRRKEREREKKKKESAKRSLGGSSQGKKASRWDGGAQYRLEPTKTRYVFREGQSLAYSIEMKASEEHQPRQRYWAGVILLITKKATPTRGDGSPYDGAQVSAWGHIEGYFKTGEKLVRAPEQDFAFPNTLPFGTTGVGDYREPSSGRRSLPCHMFLRLDVMDGIFPHAPLFEENERSQQNRKLMVQTMYGNTGRGSHSYIEGPANIVTRAAGTTTSVQETFRGSNKSGSTKIAYAFRQSGSFHASGVLRRSQTSFEIDWQGKKRAEIKVTQIPAERVIASFSNAKP